MISVYLYTQFEVPDARRVYAVFDQPDLKAVFAMVLIACYILGFALSWGPIAYKGKGIKYADEVIRRKVGKTGKK